MKKKESCLQVGDGIDYCHQLKRSQFFKICLIMQPLKDKQDTVM